MKKLKPKPILFTNSVGMPLPLLWGIAAGYWVLAAVGIVGGLAVWNMTQRPDITYNISDTGFSIAGVDVSWFLIIGVIAVAIFFIIFMGRKKPTQKEYVYVGKPPK